MEESSNKKQNINSLPAKKGFSKCLAKGQLKQSEKNRDLREKNGLEKNGSRESVEDIECQEEVLQLLRWLKQTDKGYNRHREKSGSRKQINNVNNCLEEFYRNQQTVKYFTCQLLDSSMLIGNKQMLDRKGI